MKVHQNMQVVDRKGNKGVITLVYNGQCCIRWENGMTGSFNICNLSLNGIRPA